MESRAAPARACLRSGSDAGTEDAGLPEHAIDVRTLSWREMQAVAAKLIGEVPPSHAECETIANAVPINGTGDGSGR
jgi:hypothetical protein